MMSSGVDIAANKNLEKKIPIPAKKIPPPIAIEIDV